MCASRICHIKLSLVTAVALTSIFITGCGGAISGNPTETAAAPGAKFSNIYCPISDSPIDPDKVPAELTRTYEGLEIAFCRPQCPELWDELSAKEKATRLQRPTTHSQRPPHRHRWRHLVSGKIKHSH